MRNLKNVAFLSFCPFLRVAKMQQQTEEPASTGTGDGAGEFSLPRNRPQSPCSSACPERVRSTCALLNLGGPCGWLWCEGHSLSPRAAWRSLASRDHGRETQLPVGTRAPQPGQRPSQTLHPLPPAGSRSLSKHRAEQPDLAKPNQENRLQIKGCCFKLQHLRSFVTQQ